MRFSTNLVPLRLEPSESASLGDSYHVRRVRLNLMTLVQILYNSEICTILSEIFLTHKRQTVLQ